MKIVKRIDRKSENNVDKSVAFIKYYELFKEYLIKTFISHAPYDSSEEISDFAARLTIDLENKIFKENSTFMSHYGNNDNRYENHLWKYLTSIAESLLDKSLVALVRKSHSEKLKNRAQEILVLRYKDTITTTISQKLANSETPATKKLDGYDLEHYLESEISNLSNGFITNKFPKLIKKFHYKKDFAIFNKYLEQSIKNFIQDYFRGKSVKHMRRVILYREDLPEDLFIYLMNIKGHGNLFYYKKKSDCLSIRDTKKALALIRELDLHKAVTEKFEVLLKLATKRAEYQKIIDNIRNYIVDNCQDRSCKKGVNPEIITILLYTGDYVMKKRMKIKDDQIEKAKKNLQNCVHCLGIDFSNIDNFYRI